MTDKSYTVGQLAQAIGAAVVGDPDKRVQGVAALDVAGPDDLTFVLDTARVKYLAASKAGAAIVGDGVTGPAGMTLLRAADPQEALARLLALLAGPEDLPPAGVHPTASVAPTAKLGIGVAVGPGAVVGANAVLGDGVVLLANVSVGAATEIGEQTVLFPGVVIYPRCKIGQRCRIHANAVIGADGFGYYHRKGVHHKIVHAGIVEIGDDVEIGACTCVDRAKFGATRIGSGTKVDNLAQIAHNVQIGRGALLAGMVGVAGSAQIGNYVVVGGHAGVRDNIRIGDKAAIAAMAFVVRDVEDGAEMMGHPALDKVEFMRASTIFRQLPELKKQISQLQAAVNALEQATKNHSH